MWDSLCFLGFCECFSSYVRDIFGCSLQIFFQYLFLSSSGTPINTKVSVFNVVLRRLTPSLVS